MIIDYYSFAQKYKRPAKNQFPVGMIVYKGFQGSGKSLSETKDAFEIKKSFPNCVVFSNMILYGIAYRFIASVADLKTALEYKNGSSGVLIVLDEAQSIFNKKNGVPLEVMAQFCQNRKNRRLILMTTQIWEDLDVMLRKQIKTIVNCRCLFGKIQINTYHNGEQLSYDKVSGEYVAPKRFTKIFKHNQKYYDRYDTFEVIQTNETYDRNLTAGRSSPPPAVNVALKLKKGF